MNSKIEEKLKQLPRSPGVYFHKNNSGDIIYVGKAAVLRNRVRQYFQKSRYRDPKTDLLVSEIDDIDWITVESEADALFLEAEMVRRYQPQYNILLRDDKSLQYVRIDYKSDYPTVSVVRRPLDDGAEYFGPFLNAPALRRALKYLRRAFPYATKKPVSAKRTSLYYHLGLDPGLEEGRTSLEDYRKNLRQLMSYFRGQKITIMSEIERQMKRFAKAQEFEAAAKARNQLRALTDLGRQTLFSDSEALDLSKDQALFELTMLLGLPEPPRRIEGYDVSHMQGTNNVASMVVFTNGIPDKAMYRKFKLRIPGNDDFAHMSELIHRRFSQVNTKKWGLPKLLLVDGGKGQLSSALDARDSKGVTIPMISIAKREEEVVIHKNRSIPGSDISAIIESAKSQKAVVTDKGDYLVILLPRDSNLVKLLQRIRDESHRFAVSYHSSLKRSGQVKSLLDDIPGVGPSTKKKLIVKFGSVRALQVADESQIAEVVGAKLAHVLAVYFKQ